MFFISSNFSIQIAHQKYFLLTLRDNDIIFGCFAESTQENAPNSDSTGDGNPGLQSSVSIDTCHSVDETDEREYNTL
jgi:hypothetical protein